jgi:hypothetical protein
MGDYVWVSKAMTDPDFERRLTSDIIERDVETAIKASRMNKDGQPVPQDMCPKRLVSTNDARKYLEEFDNAYEGYEPPLLNFFYAGSHCIVSEKAADIIRRFDLGGGALYPVSEGMYEFGNEIRMPGHYFTWIFGNVKQAFLPDESTMKFKLGPTSWWHMPLEMADGAAAVSRAAIDGPDVWVDPTLVEAIFLSQGLGDALDAAGLAQDFRLFRCRVI